MRFDSLLCETKDGERWRAMESDGERANDILLVGAEEAGVAMPGLAFLILHLLLERVTSVLEKRVDEDRFQVNFSHLKVTNRM
jgi:hypothetical protein